MKRDKPFISIIPDIYFGFVVMISNRKPWLRNDDGTWYFYANKFEVHLMSEYKDYLQSFVEMTKNGRNSLKIQ